MDTIFVERDLFEGESTEEVSPAEVYEALVALIPEEETLDNMAILGEN